MYTPSRPLRSGVPLAPHDLGPLGQRGPLYVRLQRVICEAIEQQSLVPGAPLPSERDLSRHFGLSRVTVRRAFDELVASGVLDRRRGSGTYVSQCPPGRGRVEKSFSTLSSFSEDMKARDRTPGSRWLSRGTGAATPEEALYLDLSPGARVHRFRRLRLADGSPMAVETSSIVGFALSSSDVVEESLYAALTLTGHRPVRALQRLRAEAAGDDRAALLETSDSHAGLLIERRAFLSDGRPVEFTRSFYRGDAYDIVAELANTT